LSAAAKSEGDHQAYISLGSNIEPFEHIPKAIERLKAETRVGRVSSLWMGPAVGGRGPDFLNAALELATPLSAEALKAELLLPIEEQLGRVRTADKYAPRRIDLDIVVFDGEVVDPDLWHHAHLATPLAEIYPGLAHPKTGEPLAQVAERLKREGGLQRVEALK
jgi:2-amino-4-hydroxy-6-hydroxymethyldihydropteridine diphosphokinase